MNTPRIIFSLCCGLIILSALAWWLTPPAINDGKTPLVWATDAPLARVAQIDLYNQLYPQNNLRLDADNTGLTKIMVQCSAGLGADLIDYIGEYNFYAYQSAGILLDITDDAEKWGCGLSTLAENIRALVQMPIITDDGEIVNRQYVYPADIYHNILLYNKNIFDQLGVPYPQNNLTWDEYVALAKKLTVYDENHRLLICGSAELNIETLIWGKGGDFFNADGTRCTLDSSEVIDAMITYHQWLHRDKIEPTPLSMAGLNARHALANNFCNLFADGKVAMYWGMRWMMSPLRKAQTLQRQQYHEWTNNQRGDAPEILRYSAVNVPHFAGRPMVTRMGARNTGINAKSKNKTAALTFLQYLASQEYAQLLNTSADGIAGNKNYYQLPLLRHAQFHNQDEAEIHRVTLDAINYGRVPRDSIFISGLLVIRYFEAVRSKIVAEENLTPENIANEMRKLTNRINDEMLRNIDRDPRLKKAYLRRLKE